MPADAAPAAAYPVAGCRACGGRLDTLLDLGRLKFSAFPKPDDPPLPTAPLDWCACAACRLVQLRHTVPASQLFVEQYWYRSAINEVMVAELADIVAQALARATPGPHDLLVDVGANDGTLLAAYRTHAATRETTRIAFEPAKNLYADCRRHAEVVIPDFFPEGLAALKAQGRVRVLTSIAMFYDLDDPRAFVRAVDGLLHRDGVWIVQFQDLWQMLRATAFDNIVSEHLCYYSLRTFEQLLEGCDLCLVDAEVRAINAGSYRLTMRRRAYADTATRRLAQLRQDEAPAHDWQTLERFAWRVGEVKAQLAASLQALTDAGKTIDAYGASTKGNTLSQVCGLDRAIIRQVWERSPEKYGRLTATGIPIVSEADGRADPPDALLLLIWQFRDAVLRREADFLAGGGLLLVPLPSMDVVSAARTARAGR